MVFCFQNGSSDQKKLKFYSEGGEFAKNCMFFRFDTLEQLKFKLEKIIGI